MGAYQVTISLIIVDQGSMAMKWYSLFIKTLRVDPIYPTPLLGQDMTQAQFLSLTGLNFRVFHLLD